MKKIYYILFVFCSITTLFAQKKVSVKQADALFKSRSYVKAAEAYEQLPQSKQVLQNLGDSYYYNFQMTSAVKAYGQLFFSHKDSVKKDVFFRYANALKGTKDFDKGDAIMTEYIGFEQNTPKFMKNITRNTPNSFKLQMMSKNKTNGDFGISFYGDKVTFASLRNGGEKNAYGWNDRPYLDLFSATVSSDGQLTKVEPFSDVINTKKHESNATFSADLKTMYFNRSGEKQNKIGDEKVAMIKIYKAELVNGKWANVTMLPFSSDSYSVEHPFLTKDGKKLYFASDMPGSLGSFDIYVVDVNEDGTYSQPRNLGETINTNQREQFPFLTEDGTLYFASDGHQGNGNLDVFMAMKLSDTEFDKPLNLGSTINSEMDDFNFILDEKTGKGYFASNRTGDDNLYTFTQEENKLQYLVEGEVRDMKSMQLLPGSTVKLFNEAGELLEEVVVGKDGSFTFNTEPNKKYKIMAFKDFYIPAEATFDTSQKGKVYIDLQMKVESYYDAEDIINKKDDGTVLIELENIYFDLDKWNIKPQAAEVLNVLLGILKKYPYMEIEIGSHTDSRASDMYNLRLSNKRAASALEYLVQNGIDRKRLRSIGYGETKPLIICPKNDCTEAEHAANRRCTFMILK
ncbi:OmpA family protein [Flavobacterium wongokense]|uniref:OmpA family protein n=1 Tax=Flavobacterium wongokense TaxID=2910674 RepID=UPI001F43C4D5|nr:OmpA family protein [Flavobacterium sp. WG47]MCF6133024.1 OmpA family protein [Flavobacterium sp. WG47]